MLNKFSFLEIWRFFRSLHYMLLHIPLLYIFIYYLLYKVLPLVIDHISA